MNQLKENEMEKVNGGAAMEGELPDMSNPSCVRCGKPASYVTMTCQRGDGSTFQEKETICMDCVEKEKLEREKQGERLINLNAIL